MYNKNTFKQKNNNDKEKNTAVFTEQKWDKVIKNKKLPKFFKRLSGFKSEFEYNTVFVIKICLQFQ